MAVRADEVRAKATLDSTEFSRGARQATGDMEKMGRATDQLNRFMVTAGSLLGVTFGVEAVRRIGNYALELGKLAASADTTAQMFERIAVKAGTTATAELEKMRQAVGGTMSDLILMQKVGAAVDAGLTFDQSITALEFLRRYSIAFGKDFNQLMSTIFTGLQRGSVLMLDDAGIMISATDTMFKGLSDLDKKSALVGEAIRQMGEKMETLPEITANAVTEADRAAAAWENLGAVAGEAMEGIGRQSSGLGADVLEAMASALDDSADAMKRLREEQAKLQGDGDRGGFLVDPTDLEVDRLRAVAGDTVKYQETLKHLLDIRRGKVKDDIHYIQVLQDDRLAQKDVTDEMVRRILKTEELEGLLDSLTNADVAQSAAMGDSQKALRAFLVEAVDLQDFLNPEGREASIEFWRELSSRLIEAKTKAVEVGDPFRELQDIIAVYSDKLETVKDLELPELSMDDDREVMNARLKFLDELPRAELRAAEDSKGIAKMELDAWKDQMVQKAEIGGATFEELIRLANAYNTALGNIGKDEETRHILLFFDADVSQVKTQSDLAAYSIGLLADQLRGLDPAIRDAVNGIQQIVVGAKAGGASGWASIIGGGVSIVSGVLGHFSKKAEEARQRLEELNQRMVAAAQAAGEYARSLESEPLYQLQFDFNNAIRAMRQELESTGGGIIKANLELYQYTGHTGRSTAATAALSNELNRLEEAIGRFSGTAVTYQQSLSKYQHELRMTGVDDPETQLRMLRTILSDVGIFIHDTGDISGNISQMNISERWSIEETIAQLNRDIIAEEIKAREEQAKTIIEAIQRQETDVQRALDDALEVQRQAMLRNVRLRFDLEEAALRQQFLPGLIGAGQDPLETARVLDQMRSEIDLLSLQEQAAGTAELAGLREAYDAQTDANTEATRLQIEAVEQATQDLGTTFKEALTTNLNDLAISLGSTFATRLDLAVGASTADTDRLIDGLGQMRMDAIAPSIESLEATLGGELSVVIQSLDTIATGLGGMQVGGASLGPITVSSGPISVSVDMSTTDGILREIAALNAGMLQVQIAAFVDMGHLGGFAGSGFKDFIRLAQLVGRNLPSYDVGGTVPGPIGAPQLAVVHGGETVYAPGQSSQVAVRFDGPLVSVSVQGGSSGTEAGRVYREAIEPQIANSIQGGRIGQLLQRAIQTAIQRAR